MHKLLLSILLASIALPILTDDAGVLHAQVEEEPRHHLESTPVSRQRASDSKAASLLKTSHGWKINLRGKNKEVEGLSDFLSFLTKHKLAVPKNVILEQQEVSVPGASEGFYIRLSEQAPTDSHVSIRAINIHELFHIYFQQSFEHYHPNHLFVAYMKLKRSYWRAYWSVETADDHESAMAAVRKITSELKPWKEDFEASLVYQELFADLGAAMVLMDPELFSSLDTARSFEKGPFEFNEEKPAYTTLGILRPVIWKNALKAERTDNVTAFFNLLTDSYATAMHSVIAGRLPAADKSTYERIQRDFFERLIKHRS